MTEPPLRRRSVGAGAVARALDDAARGAAPPVRVVVVVRDAPDDARDAAERAGRSGARVIVVPPAEIRRLVGGGATDTILGIAGPPPDATLGDAMREPGAAWLLAGVAYPGNAGLSIRTAEVSGAALAAVAPPLAGEERRGALRASIGADRFFPVFFGSAAEVVDAARAAGRRIVVLETTGDRAPWDADLTGPVLLVAGAERDGVPPDVLRGADAVVRLPAAGAIPSYNVQAAIAAVAAERMRQESVRRRESTESV